MGHHASEESFHDDMGKMFNLGPTGKFPNGKIADNDEGEIKLGITTLNERIVMDFGKSIRTIGFTKEQAIDIANVLFESARNL